MDSGEWLAERFEENRSHLRAVAYRMLGSFSEADDAVQESWLRLSRSNADAVTNLGGWLTTVTARVCLDMLRSRAARREEPLGDHLPDTMVNDEEAIDPEQDVLLADSVGPALLVVLDTLTPAERLAFVLHDMFAVPFDEIAQIVGRSPTAARQLASRARRRVQGASPATVDTEAADHARHRKIVDAFLAASRGGDFDALLELLDPDVELRARDGATAPGLSGYLRGASVVAGFLSGRAHGARLATINGAAGAVWAPGGQVRVVFDFTIVDGKIVRIELVSDPERLKRFDVTILED